MAMEPERARRYHGYTILACLASLFTIFFVLRHGQTDVWHHISSYIADGQVSQFYPPNYAVDNTTASTSYVNRTEALRYQLKNNGYATQIIPEVTPYVNAVRNSFELVMGVSSSLYIYSALWDVHHVRLESIKVQGYKFKRLLCVFYYTNDTTQPGIYVKPVVKELHTYKSPYTSSVVKCPVKSAAADTKAGVPRFVGVVEKEFDVPKQIFTIENVTGVRQEFTVCIPAMHGMNNTALLIQQIEMVRLFGAGRIVLYNHSISSSVDTALRMYAREWGEGRGKLEVVTLPWKLPMENGEPIKIPYFAQQLAIDECMYRYKRLSKYMVFNDLDEYLFPVKHANWSALIADRRRLKPRNRVWLFRSAVLRKDRPSPAKGFEQDYFRFGSSILGLTSRDKSVFPIHVREKCMIDPTAIEEKAVHWVWDAQDLTDNLHLDVGLLFHYRVPLHLCEPQVKETRLVDKYGKRLVAGLKQAWSKLPGVKLGWSPFKAADKSKCKYF